jgi:hypothetical protein
VDFSWPPKDEDLAACEVVPLSDADGQPLMPLVAFDADADQAFALVDASAASPAVAQVEPTPEAPVAPDEEAEPDEVEARSSALARFMIECARREDPEVAGATRSAWLALFVAAACALVTYTEFQAGRLSSSSEGSVLQSVYASEPVPNPDDVPRPATTPAAAPKPSRPIRLQFTVVDPRQAVSRGREAAVEPDVPLPVPQPSRRLPLLAKAAHEPVVRRSATPALTRPPVPAPAPALAARVEAPRPEPARPAATAARVEATSPPPAPAPVVMAAARPEAPAPRPEPPAVRPEAISTRVDVPVPNEEDDIRLTLARWRTAYSQLNASAAQEVWPSVDVRALRSAFRGLKSQELHFDRCHLTVTGSHARAACSGRAIYVPGVGDQSPRTAAREWNFELRKADQRWQIASARSSSSS